nr:unnamed protein product [Callosobruchus analis]
MSKNKKGKINESRIEEPEEYLTEADHIAQLQKENNLLTQLVQEKEIFIYQLINENRHLQDQYELIIFNISDKETIIDSLKMIETKIEQTKDVPVTTRTYAEVAYAFSSSNVKKDSLKKLLILPNEKQHSLTTKKDPNKHISLSKINVKVHAAKDMNDGGVEVKVNKEDLLTLKDKIQKKLPTKYNIIESKPIVPRIKITGYKANEEPNEEELRDDIVNQNPCIEKDDIKITYIKRNKENNNYTIYADVKSKVLDTTEKNGGKILLSFQNLRAFQNNFVGQCKNCFRFRHSAGKCKNKQTCSKCGEEHASHSCRSIELKCINCIYRLQYCP